MHTFIIYLKTIAWQRFYEYTEELKSKVSEKKLEKVTFFEFRIEVVESVSLLGESISIKRGYPSPKLNMKEIIAKYLLRYIWEA